MGDKYIIELEEKPFHKDNGDFLYRVKGFNSLVFDMNGIQKLILYTEPDTTEAYQRGVEDGAKSVENWNEQEKKLRMDEAYQKGLSDAWEMARKIQDTGGNLNWWIHNTSASEAIEKIRAYEQEKEEVQVGDEVRNIENRWIAVVCNIEGECMTLMDTNGALGDGYHVNRFTKTGRHFPEIAEVLRKMKEES